MGSSLEEKIWYELKKKSIDAERQYLAGEGKEKYRLDFAIFCKKGNIDVECNGDFRQSRRSQIYKDNLREHLLSSQGWSILRFEKREISSNLSSCFELIEKIINSKGGVQNQNSIRKFFKNQELEQLILD